MEGQEAFIRPCFHPKRNSLLATAKGKGEEKPHWGEADPGLKAGHADGVVRLCSLEKAEAQTRSLGGIPLKGITLKQLTQESL